MQQIIPLPEIEAYQVKIRQQATERRESRKPSRDYTKYIFNGNLYNKKDLVLAVVQNWQLQNQPQSLKDLQKIFPQNLNTRGLFKEWSDAVNIYKKQGKKRHYIEKEEIFNFSDGSSFAISDQWDKEDIIKFIDLATKVGCTIQEG